MVKRLFSSDFLFYGFFIALLLIISQIAIVAHIFHTPPGYYYAYLDKISPSDWYYPAVVRFGMGPFWLLKVPYIGTEHQASIIQVFFVWLGKIALITHLGPAEVLAIFRALGGILYAAGAAFLFRVLFSKSAARYAFLLFLLAQPLPMLVTDRNPLIPDVGKWIWHFGEATRRLFIMPPHYTFGKGLAIFSLALLFVFLKKKQWKYLVGSCGLMILAGIVYPPPVFLVGFAVAVGGGIWGMWEIWGKRINKREVFGLISFLFSCGVPLLLLRLELAKGYPWDMWSKVELGWNAPWMHFEWEYMQMMGILLFTGALVVFYLYRKYKEKEQFVLEDFVMPIWAYSAFVLFPLATSMGLGKFRFTEGAQMVALAACTYWGIRGIRRIRWIRGIFLGVIGVYFLIYTSTITWQSVWNFWGYWTNVYIRPDEVLALNYLNQFAPRGSIVLAENAAGNYIPAFAQVRTLNGFSDFYHDYGQFQVFNGQIVGVVKGTLSDSEARAFLDEQNVSYVYYLTYDYGPGAPYPNLLEPVFVKPGVTIYKVKGE